MEYSKDTLLNNIADINSRLLWIHSNLKTADTAMATGDVNDCLSFIAQARAGTKRLSDDVFLWYGRMLKICTETQQEEGGNETTTKR